MRLVLHQACPKGATLKGEFRLFDVWFHEVDGGRCNQILVNQEDQHPVRRGAATIVSSSSLEGKDDVF